MARTPNVYGGGSMTNFNGLYFEQKTSLDEALVKKVILLKITMCILEKKK